MGVGLPTAPDDGAVAEWQQALNLLLPGATVAAKRFRERMSLTFTIRAPYPDELPRVMRTLPPIPPQHALRIAVVGRVERLAAAAVLYFQEAEPSTGLLRLSSLHPPMGPEIISHLVAALTAEARNAGATEVVLVGSIAEDHPLADFVQQQGFEPYRKTEVYAMPVEGVLERIESLYQRIVARGMIPAGARAIVPQGIWLQKLKSFLDKQQRTLAERLDTEEGFTTEHSLALVIDGEVRGACFTRNRGRESYIGLLILDPPLRGGIAWANTFIMRQMLRLGSSCNVERLFFEVHPEDHRGSYQIARTSGAEFIRRRCQFRQDFALHPLDHQV